MRLWQKCHSNDAVSVSLHPIRWYIISISLITDAINSDHLAKRMFARLLHCEVPHSPFVINKYLEVGAVTLRLCKSPIPHHIQTLSGDLSRAMWTHEFLFQPISYNLL